MTPVCLHYKTFCKYFTMKIFVCLHYKTFFASISPWAGMQTKSFIVKLMTTRMNSWSKRNTTTSLMRNTHAFICINFHMTWIMIDFKKKNHKSLRQKWLYVVKIWTIRCSWHWRHLTMARIKCKSLSIIIITFRD